MKIRVSTVCIIMILFILSSTSVLAFAVSPARASLPYDPGKPQQASFTLYHGDDTPLLIDLHAEGPLTPYLTFPTQQQLLPYETKTVVYTLDLPSTFIRSTAETTLFITETLPEDTSEGALIATRLQFTIALHLDLPPLEGYVLDTLHTTVQDQSPSTPTPSSEQRAQQVNERIFYTETTTTDIKEQSFPQQITWLIHRL